MNPVRQLCLPFYTKSKYSENFVKHQIVCLTSEQCKNTLTNLRLSLQLNVFANNVMLYIKQTLSIRCFKNVICMSASCKIILIFLRILWLIIVLLGITGSIFMVQLFWQRYLSNPTRSSILSFHAPTTTIPFPAVTICNINRIITSKLEKFVKSL